MSAHTPGPWRACEPGSNFHKGKLFIRPASGESLIAVVSGEASSTERRANARLIAAAPDLLAALRDAVRDFAIMRYGSRMETWDAAIVKAEGK